MTDTITTYAGRPIHDLTRDELIEAVENLGATLEQILSNQKDFMDIVRIKEGRAR